MTDQPSKSELLKAGATSYPQAFAAMIEFCRLTSSMMRTSLEENVAGLSKAMRVPLSVSDLKGRATPSSIHPDSAGIDGTKAQIGFAIWGEPDWRQYYYVTWNKSGVSISARIRFKREQSAVARTVSALRRHGLGDMLWQDGNVVGIAQKVEPEDLPQLHARMNDLLSRWTKFWESAGGIDGCLHARAAARAGK